MKRSVLFVLFVLTVFSLTSCAVSDKESLSETEPGFSEIEPVDLTDSQTEETAESDVLATESAESEEETLSSEEEAQLKAAHPECFGLDTSEGLNVLMHGGINDWWNVRLVAGTKDHFSIFESIEVTAYRHLTLEEAKKILIYYGLPDEQITLRPYDDPWVSSYTLSMLLDMMGEEGYFTKMAEAFDNRYQVGGEIPIIYDPEIDTYPEYDESMEHTESP